MEAVGRTSGQGEIAEGHFDAFPGQRDERVDALEAVRWQGVAVQSGRGEGAVF